MIIQEMNNQPPKTGLFFISVCQSPIRETIGRPNVANYDLAFYDGKMPSGPRIIASFWGIITSRADPGGNPG
jgi:hypothetical protein